MEDGADRHEAPGEASAAAPGEANEDVPSKVQRLISRINARQEDPDPRHFHALASMLESQQARYVKESANSSFSGSRSAHAIGRLESILHENDEFVLSLSTKYLAESGYSVAVRAAATRLLLCGASSWMVFDDTVTENAKNWLMNDSLSDCLVKNEVGRNTPSDFEMLKTYATGILAMSLTTGGDLVEDVLSAGLSAKLMRYLRLRVMANLNSLQKDSNLQTANKHASVTSSSRVREDTRSRLRLLSDSARCDGSGGGNENFFPDSKSWRDPIRYSNTGAKVGEDLCGDHMPSLRSESLEVVTVFDDVSGDAQLASSELCIKDPHDLQSKHSERHAASRSIPSEVLDENSRNDLRSQNHGISRRERGSASEGLPVEIERNVSLVAECNADGLGMSVTVSELNTDDGKGPAEIQMCTDKTNVEYPSINEVQDDRANFSIGSRDISYLVRKAIQAAEAEARAANAPAETVKAAGDAAADLVKTSTLEVWKESSDVEAAVLAASEAASTIADASAISEMLRSASVKEDAEKATEYEAEEELDEFFILDCEPLAHLRDKYSIECLIILGEYVEALGPVLHEKGVDVCLALLQRSLNLEDANNQVLLPKVLKLICALAAHRKFAALFIDRGGMQKLLSVDRIPETFLELSSCLFTIGTQGIMERVCALPSGVVNRVVELALQLLECSQDQARKNAAIFFNSAFVFRAILDSFDEQEGLQKMLNLLQSTASVRSGGTSAAPGLSNVGYQHDRPQAEVLTASEKQLAYHTCIALRQYFRAHLILLFDSIRPSKASRSTARSNSIARAAYKPLDLSNEAMDSVFLQIQRDRKVGPSFVRARWAVADKFLALNGHIIMLELCQAPVVERYLHDLAQYALGILHIVTLIPYSRKLIVHAALSNDRFGMAVILDTLNGSGGFVDPEVICPALDVLVNLVCPPPSISIKPPASSTEVRERHSERSTIDRNITVPTEVRERHSERSTIDRNITVPTRLDLRDRNVEPLERGIVAASGIVSSGFNSQIAVPSLSSGLVGDRRISLGTGSGCAGLAAQLEQVYRQAREAVRANNGIKVLLHLLHPRMLTPPIAQDHIRALVCRILLGLARDDTIAHILTKLQVGKKLSELIRDSGGQSSGSEQDRWQSELAQVAIELISIVTNSGRASTLVATDAAAPTLRRIERAAIAAATPIAYHSRELLLLILEHLQMSGLMETAASLLKEASLTPLPSLSVPQPPLHQTSAHDTSYMPFQWPSGRSSCGFLAKVTKQTLQEDETPKSVSSVKKKRLQLSSSISFGRNQLSSQHTFTDKASESLKKQTLHLDSQLTLNSPACKVSSDHDRSNVRTPIFLPMKRKLTDSKDAAPQAKRLATLESMHSPGYQTPIASRRISVSLDSVLHPLPGSRDQGRTPLIENTECSSIPRSLLASGPSLDTQPGTAERMTLDSLVVQYLKHQHRQCPAPITTLPPLSLLHPHVCPEPSHKLDASVNVGARVYSREFRKVYGGIHARRRDRQFVYSRFKQWRTCRDDLLSPSLLTCIAFLDDTYQFATGSKSGELKIFDCNSGQVLETCSSHQSLVTMIQSSMYNESQMILSSSSHDVKLWDASIVSAGPLHTFEGCKAARFSRSGIMFAALSADQSYREILLYDINKYDVVQKLQDSSNSNGQSRMHVQSLIHFSPLDTMLLWNGSLWDRRSSTSIHNFDQFSDYGGGGFHPSGNEVIINSEVWDLRKFKLLRSVPSLDQTFVSFNAGGDIIYATLRRNLEDLKSALNVRRLRQPLSAAFRTIDAVNYSDIATIPVDRCILDFTTEPTDSFVGMITMDDHDELSSSARIYEIGRRRPTDDSDLDDDLESDEDEDDEDDDSEPDIGPLLGSDLDGEGDSDDSNEDDVDSADELDDDLEFTLGDVDLDGQEMLEIATDGEDDDGSDMVESSSDEGEFAY